MRVGVNMDPRKAVGGLRFIDFTRPHYTGADADVLREAADWLDSQPEGTVLIGLWSVGFAGPGEVNIQMVVDQGDCP